VQDEVRQQGLDPMQNPGEFGEVVSKRFQELGFNDLALKTQLQIRQIMPEQTGTSRVVRGGTEAGSNIGLSEGESAVVEFGPNGQVAGIKDRTQTDPDEAPKVTNQRMVDLESGRRAVVGTLDNQLVELTSDGPQPLRESFATEEEDAPEVKGTSRFRNKNTGETFQLVRTGKGLAIQSVDANGNPTYKFVNSNDYEEISAAQSADVNEFGVDIESLKNRKNSVQSFARRAQNLSSRITEENLGVPGALARFGSEIGAATTGIVRQSTGIDLDPAAEKVDAYSATFDELGLSERSAEVKSGLVSASIAKAFADQNGKGELRKNEVERAMKSLRVGTGDPDQIKAVLGDTVETLISDYNTARENEMQAAGVSELTLSALDPADYGVSGRPEPRDTNDTGGSGNSGDEVTASAISRMSAKELRNLNQDDPAFNDPEVLGALQDRLLELRGAPSATSPDREQRQRGGAR